MATKAPPRNSLAAQYRVISDRESQIRQQRKETEKKKNAILNEINQKLKQQDAAKARLEEKKRLADELEKRKKELARKRAQKKFYSDIMKACIRDALGGVRHKYLPMPVGPFSKSRRVWKAFEDAGFSVVIQNEKNDGKVMHVLLDWSEPYSGDANEHVWINAGGMFCLSTFGNAISGALRKKSIDGDTQLTVSMTKGGSDADDDPYRPRLWDVLIKDTEAYLEFAAISPPVLIRVFKTLGFDVEVKWNRKITREADYFDGDSGGELFVRW